MSESNRLQSVLEMQKEWVKKWEAEEAARQKRAEEALEKYKRECSPKELEETCRAAKVSVASDCGIARKFLQARFDRIPPPVRAEMEACFSDAGLYLYGPVGVGKTYILSALIFKQIENEWPKEPIFYLELESPKHKWQYDGEYPHLICMPAMLAKIRESFNGGKKTVSKIIQEYIDESILFLDDIGVEKPTEYVIETLYLIINGRYEEEKQTVFSSNLSPVDLANRIGDRTVSRMLEMCKVIEITGKDRRLEQTKQ